MSLKERDFKKWVAGSLHERRNDSNESLDELAGRVSKSKTKFKPIEVVTIGGQNIKVQFPATFQNWKQVTASIESFFRARGYMPFVTPSSVIELTFDPEIDENILTELIIEISGLS